MPEGNAAGLATGRARGGTETGFRGSHAPAQAPTLELEIRGAGHHAPPADVRRRSVGARHVERHVDLRVRRKDAAAVLGDARDVLAGRERGRSKRREQNGGESDLGRGGHSQSPDVARFAWACIDVFGSTSSEVRRLSIVYIVQRSMIRTYLAPVSLADHQGSANRSP